MRRLLLPILPLLFILLSSVVFADDLAALIDQSVRGSDEARLKVIDAGLPAIPGLVEVIRTQTGVPAERAAQTIGWIAQFAGDTPRERAKAEWMLVNLLLDKQQPMAARQAAARHLWHVASGDSAAVLAGFIADPDLGTEVLWSLENLRGAKAMRALTEAYEANRGKVRTAVIETLGRRRDAPVGVLTKAARDEEATVRTAALEGLGRKAELSVASFLEGRIGETQGDERVAALLAYVSVGDNVLAAGDRDAARRIYESALEAGGNVRPVVVRALEGLGESGNAETPQVISRFMGRSNHSVQVAAAGALARLPGEQATQVLAAGLESASPQRARPILSALADRGDPAAAEAVIPLARVDSVDVRLMALRALGRMGDRAACEVILESCQDPNAAEEVRKAAFGAYLAVGAAQLAQGHEKAARGIGETALATAHTEAQKIAALQELQQVADPESLAAIEPSLHAEGAVQEAALDAYLAAANTLAVRGEPKAAIDAYMQLLDIVKTGPRVIDIVTRLGALGSSVDVGSRNGFVTHWWVIGPFPSDEQYGGTDTVFFPEQGVDLTAEQKLGNQTLKWRHQHTLDAEGIMDYLPMFRPNENVVCYAYAEVKLEPAIEARLHLGSDDSLVVWINGQEAFRFKGPRGLKVGQDTKDIELRAGTNAVLIKVVQGPGDWSSSVQLTDRSDQPLKFEQRTE